MKITHCKLKKSTQKSLLEFFVLEVTLVQQQISSIFSLIQRFCFTIKFVKSSTTIVIKRKIKPDSWVYTDTYRSYDALDVREFHHERINHSEIFAERENHINGIENFWSQAKRVLRK